MSVSGQAGEGNDLSSEAIDTLQAQAAPAYSAQAASCPTASYTVEDGDTYLFEDISATGTPLNMVDDMEEDIPIGFTFNYYCGAYTTLRVSDNGVLSFDPAANITYDNSCLPSSSPNYTTLIAPFWDDLDPSPADADVLYEVKGTAPNRRLIVQWHNISYWPSSAGRVTFQAILFEGTDKILFQYADVTFGTAADGGASATVGIQKDGATALQYSCNTATLAAGRAILFSPQVDPCPTAGYYYDDMVPYSFDDISATGTDLGLVGDDVSADIDLPFDFSFYCASYGAVRISTNGFINFLESGGADYTNVCLPTGEHFTMIGAFWDDMSTNPMGGITPAIYYQVKGSAPNRRFIIQYQDVRRVGVVDDSMTFQLILYETTNKILFQYQDLNVGNATYDAGASATVGVQKDDSVGVGYSCNSASLSDGLAILFTPYMEVTLPYPPTGIDYDCQRNGVWVTSGASESLDMLDPVSGVVVKSIVLTGKVIGTDENAMDAAVLDNGNLLLTNFNGDSLNIGAFLYEFNPDTETLVNYWPLDGTWNTATDGTSISDVRGVEMVFEPFRRAYVTRSGDNNVYEVQLTPGKPGTWKTLAVHTPPSLLNSTCIDKVACYEDTPITGYVIADRDTSVVNFYNDNFTLNSNFNAQHGTHAGNYGVTVVPGNPAKLWVSDYDSWSTQIGIFDTQQKCSMHCGKFPWPMFLPGIEQGPTP
jgi:hypothetical protein